MILKYNNGYNNISFLDPNLLGADLICNQGINSRDTIRDRIHLATKYREEMYYLVIILSDIGNGITIKFK